MVLNRAAGSQGTEVEKVATEGQGSKGSTESKGVEGSLETTEGQGVEGSLEKVGTESKGSKGSVEGQGVKGSSETTNADDEMEEVVVAETAEDKQTIFDVQAEQRRLIETKRMPRPAVKVKVKAMPKSLKGSVAGAKREVKLKPRLSSILLPSFVERATKGMLKGVRSKKKKISPKRAATEVASSSKRYKVAEPAEAPTLEMLRVAIPRRTMEQHLADHAHAVQEATEKAKELAGNTPRQAERKSPSEW